MNSVKLIVGIVTSLAVGTAIGILFAPEKGSKSRKKIFNKGENITEDLEKKFNVFISDARKLYESVSRDATITDKSKIDRLKEISTSGNKL